MTSPPGPFAASAFPPIDTPRTLLVSLLPAVADALLSGTAASLPLAIPDGWPDDHDRGFIALRRCQTDADPGVPEWVRLMIARDEAGPGGGPLCIGHAGFHGPPGVNGPRAADALEVGYTVFPAWRGRGLAQEAVRSLVAWGHAAHGISRFFGSVQPGAAPSIAVLERCGFAHVGEQWDDEDGLELVYELRLPAAG